MGTPLERFLDITELIDLLATSLTLSDIARLMRSSHALHDAFQPCFYHELKKPDRGKRRLFTYKAAVQALSRNIHHVRQWNTGVYDTAYVYNGLLAFQEELDFFTASDTVAAFGHPGSRPPWLPPPDDLYSDVTPLAPMSNLVKVNIQLDTHTELDPGPYNRMGIFRVRRSLYQACWILQSSCCSNLVELTLKPLVLRSRRDLRLVTATIRGLVNLSSLSVGLVDDTVDCWENCSTILHSCPPSVRNFCIFTSILVRGPRIKGWGYDHDKEEDSREDNNSEDAEEASEGGGDEEVQQDNNFDDGEEEEVKVAPGKKTDEGYEEAEDEYSEGEEDEYSESEEEHSEEEEYTEYGEDSDDDFDFSSRDSMYSETDDSGSDRDLDSLPEIPRRALPLINLSYLNPWDMLSDTTLDDICAFFSCCPNIDQLEIPQVHRRKDEDVIAKIIVGDCPKITALSYHAHGFGGDGDFDHTIMFRILDHMPAQKARKISFSSIEYLLDPSLATRAFQRHSDSLRSLRLSGAFDLPSKTLKAIFQECRGLEELYFHSNYRTMECYIALEDAVSGKWVCSRIRHLEITIGFKKLTAGPKDLPYYKRESPLVLSVEEAEQFDMLEEVYRRLGALRELEYADIRACAPGNNGFDKKAFPAMLNLGDPTSNRPGYLDLLKGWTKLQWLRGSVRVNTDETKVIVGERESLWIEKHWLSLRGADFFDRGDVIEGPFKELQDRRRDRGPALTLTAK